jgi:hypothetical protein
MRAYRPVGTTTTALAWNAVAEPVLTRRILADTEIEGFERLGVNAQIKHVGDERVAT